MTVKKVMGTAKAVSNRPGMRVFSTDNTHDPLRPSKETATRLVALLSQCEISANSVAAQMQHNLDLLKDARLELRTAINILADSNKLAEDRHAGTADLSAIAEKS